MQTQIKVSSLSNSSSNSSQIPSLKRDMIIGSLWMVAMRWSIRGIGLISTMILARLLVPQDFGLVAMATIVVGLLDTLSSFGVDMALIQKDNAHTDHFDTAWTIQVIQGFSVAFILLLAAPSAALYFREPRVVALIRFLSFGVFIGGFSNVGVIAFRKDLDFNLEFRFSVLKKIISFIVTLTAALLLRNYWSLVIGMVVGQLLGVVLSYKMHPYRPSISLRAVKDIWSFSQSMLFINIGNYVYERGDELTAGKLTGSRGMGIYAVGYEISNLPTTELLFPLSRALFPGYAKLASEPERLIKAYLNVLGFITIFSMVTGCGIALMAEELTIFILGPKWLDAIPIIRCLAIFGIIRSIYGQAGTLHIALGHTKRLAIITWIQIAVLFPSIMVAGTHYHLLGIAIVKVAIAFVFSLTVFGSLIQITDITATDLFRRFWRPLIAATAMLPVSLLSNLFFRPGTIQSILMKSALAIPIYISVLFSLWHLSKRPEGTEQIMLDFLRRQKQNWTSSIKKRII